jgi:hypothetical protein
MDRLEAHEVKDGHRGGQASTAKRLIKRPPPNSQVSSDAKLDSSLALLADPAVAYTMKEAYFSGLNPGCS